MTFNVYYTERAQPNSSFVDRAWYDDTRSRLSLELHGQVYEYDSVHYATYDSLIHAASPGSYYREHIKGVNHGRYLGPVANMVEVKTSHDVPEPVSVGAFNPNSVRFHNGYQPLPVQSQKKFSLAQSNDKLPEKLDYTLHFVLEDHNSVSDERSHTLQATSLDDAIDQFLDLVGKLNQNVVLKGASVRFE